MPVTCSSCFVTCMDFRIQETIAQLAASLGIATGDFDRVSVAGGAANREQVEYHLKLATDLHAVERIVLTVHEDCGTGAVPEDLVEALRMAREQFPGLEIQGFYVKLDGTFDEMTVPDDMA